MKGINDFDGHAAGNDVLREAGEVLARGCEPGEQVARIGGDGFTAITSLSGSDSVRALCGRLTIALAEEGVKVSFGWPSAPAPARPRSCSSAPRTSGSTPRS
jgi:GGDEF domain-containing protein